MKEWTDGELSCYAQKKANEKGVVLSSLAKVVYIMLIRLFQKEATYSREKKAYYVQYSINEFANLFQIGGKSTLINIFRKLDNCGLIEHVQPDNPKKGKSKNVKIKETYIDFTELEKQ